MLLYRGLELREIVDSPLAMGSGDDMFGVVAQIERDFAPGGLYGLDRVGKSAIL